MVNNLGQTILQLRNTGVMVAVDDFFEGNTGSFDIREQYYDVDQIRYSDNSIAEICKVSMEIAQNYLEQVREESKISDVSDTELLLYSAWRVSQKIKHQEDNYNAMWQAEEYSNDDDKVQYYGTNNRAYNKGYDHYMENSDSTGDNYLDCIINMYEEINKKSK